MPSLDVNILAVLVAGAAHMALGALWYGPLFGKLWLQAIGKTEEEIGNAGPALAIAAASALVTAFALALFLTVPSDPDVGTGLVYGAIGAVGLAATSEATAAAFESRNVTVALLYIAYQVVGLLIMGAILGAWQ